MTDQVETQSRWPRRRIIKWAIVPAAVVVLLAWSGFTSPARASEAEVVRVVDGDTVDVKARGREFRVRILNVDTPEVKDEYGKPECLSAEATDATKTLLPPGTKVSLSHDVERTDKYDRVLAHVSTPDGTDVAEELARRGLAVPVVVGKNDDRIGAIKAAFEVAEKNDEGFFDPKEECTVPAQVSSAEKWAAAAAALTAGASVASADKAAAKASALGLKIYDVRRLLDSTPIARQAMKAAGLDKKLMARLSNAETRAETAADRLSDISYARATASAPSGGGGGGRDFDVPDWLCPTRFC